jgi:hypothetical protein
VEYLQKNHPESLPRFRGELQGISHQANQLPESGQHCIAGCGDDRDAIVTNDKEAIEEAEGHGREREEVHGGDGLAVIVEKG